MKQLKIILSEFLASKNKLYLKKVFNKKTVNIIVTLIEAWMRDNNTTYLSSSKESHGL